MNEAELCIRPLPSMREGSQRDFSGTERPSMALERDRWISAGEHRRTTDVSGCHPASTPLAWNRRRGAAKHGAVGCLMVAHYDRPWYHAGKWAVKHGQNTGLAGGCLSSTPERGERQTTAAIAVRRALRAGVQRPGTLGERALWWPAADLATSRRCAAACRQAPSLDGISGGDPSSTTYGDVFWNTTFFGLHSRAWRSVSTSMLFGFRYALCLAPNAALQARAT
jgi:hypothetical protein